MSETMDAPKPARLEDIRLIELPKIPDPRGK